MNKMHYSYNPKLKEYAHEHRIHPTFAEKCLWYSLRGKQLQGFDFDRQKPIGEYIYDFFCSELRLVIEIDGITHNDENIRINDEAKNLFAGSIGLNILRFTDDEVLGGGDLVINKIKEYIKATENSKK